jgi:uncharacterized protein
MIDEAPANRQHRADGPHASRWLRAERGGCWSSTSARASRVQAGQPLWTTVSPLGAERASVAAEDGYVIGATTLPLVQPGRPAARRAPR